MAQNKFINKSSLSSQFSDIPQSQKILIGVIIVIGLALIWYFSYFQNLYSKAQKLNSEITQLSDFEKKLPLEMKKYAIISKKLQKYKEMLPEKEEIPKLLVDINSTIKKVGVSMNRFSPQTVNTQSQNATYSTVPIQISISGSYNQIGTAFEALSNMPRLVKIVDFSISPSSNPNILNVDFKAETYSLKNSEQNKNTKESK
ncbi:type 4a pilus biogenesis protein PilO [Desulfurella sp.]|uniref:type 4a pilus biogenesis protein PilO n=1 Tax=Desulfurella sp. TaxID=1962857 RepID=UPI0025BF9126|nr:type 4a pilus biogenesis protein PilO [Desulfurella sp.]